MTLDRTHVRPTRPRVCVSARHSNVRCALSAVHAPLCLRLVVAACDSPPLPAPTQNKLQSPSAHARSPCGSRSCPARAPHRRLLRAGAHWRSIDHTPRRVWAAAASASAASSSPPPPPSPPPPAPPPPPPPPLLGWSGRRPGERRHGTRAPSRRARPWRPRALAMAPSRPRTPGSGPGSGSRSCRRASSSAARCGCDPRRTLRAASHRGA